MRHRGCGYRPAADKPDWPQSARLAHANVLASAAHAVFRDPPLLSWNWSACASRKGTATRAYEYSRRCISPAQASPSPPRGIARGRDRHRQPPP
ncbi:hypothetical protein ACPA9J_27160 [Pseudomonas aeruginosa]